MSTVLAGLAALALALSTPAARSSGRGAGRGVPITRRGANRQWYEKRRAADPAARKARGPRAQRWEREGDALYADISIDPTIQFAGMDGAALEAEAERMLAGLAEVAPATEAERSGAPALASPVAAPAEFSNVMWGGCSVGPVLRAKLASAGLEAPTEVQRAAFGPISKGKNALLCAETGSGKTLAYVLPLLAARLKRDVPCQALVVCPSREVALQLRASGPGRAGWAACSAPSARLAPPWAQAAPMRPGAPPQQLGGAPSPEQLASAPTLRSLPPPAPSRRAEVDRLWPPAAAGDAPARSAVQLVLGSPSSADGAARPSEREPEPALASAEAAGGHVEAEVAPPAAAATAAALDELGSAPIVAGTAAALLELLQAA